MNPRSGRGTLLRYTALYGSAQLVAPVSQLILLVILTHLTSSSVIGSLTIITATEAFTTVLGTYWWSQYSIRAPLKAATPLFQLDDSNFRAATFVVAAFHAVVSLTVAVVLVNIVLRDEFPGYIYVIFISLYFMSRGLNSYCSSHFAVTLNALYFALTSALPPLIGTCLALVFVHQFGASLACIICGLLSGELLAVGVVAVSMKLLPLRLGRAPWAHLDTGARYGAPLALAGAFSWVTSNGPRYVVERFMGLASTGHFSVGFGLGQRAAGMVSSVISAAALPLVLRAEVQHGLSSGKRQLDENLSLLLFLLLPALCGAWLVSDQLVRLFIASEYWASVRALLPWALLAGGAGAILNGFHNHALLLERRSDLSMTMFGVDAMITISLSLLLVGPYGLTGAAMGAGLGRVVSLVALTLAGMRLIGLSVPWKGVLRTLLATATMGLVVWFSPTEASLPAIAARVVIGTITYALACLLVNRNVLRRIGLLPGRNLSKDA